MVGSQGCAFAKATKNEVVFHLGKSNYGRISHSDNGFVDFVALVNKAAGRPVVVAPRSKGNIIFQCIVVNIEEVLDIPKGDGVGFLLLCL